jgi:SAM-dependent methyltransferase
MPEQLAETLQRLKQERDEADRRYNEALTALDKAISPPADVPDVPPLFDTHQLAALNDAWNIIPDTPPASGLQRKLTSFIWRMVAPYLQRQLTFNSWLVDHLNRNIAAQREAQRGWHHQTAVLCERFASLAEFQTRLIQYLQQITAYVDTRDREAASGHLILNASISGVAENLDKRAESLVAREQRLEERTAALTAAHEELRAIVAVAQQGSLAMKRQLERLELQHQTTAAPFESSKVVRQPGSSQAFAPALDAYKYVAFEDQFRGSREVIRQRMESYLPFFAGASDVLDVGCGRGEFLELLAISEITARGIDLNREMVEVCRARGLDVTEADAVSYLSELPDASLGGLLAAQVVEHLQPEYLLRFLELAFHKLRPGARLVLETLNPACWVAFFESYIRDVTHVWPLHPETLKYLVLASGFAKTKLEFRSPVPLQDRLQPIAVPAGADVTLVELAEAFNANVEKLNSRMFTFMDYAVIGERG